MEYIDGANKVLEILENNGFEGYIVGGYVRDILFGIEPLLDKLQEFYLNALNQQILAQNITNYLMDNNKINYVSK